MCDDCLRPETVTLEPETHVIVHCADCQVSERLPIWVDDDLREYVHPDSTCWCCDGPITRGPIPFVGSTKYDTQYDTQYDPILGTGRGEFRQEFDDFS